MLLLLLVYGGLNLYPCPWVIPAPAYVRAGGALLLVAMV